MRLCSHPFFPLGPGLNSYLWGFTIDNSDPPCSPKAVRHHPLPTSFPGLSGQGFGVKLTGFKSWLCHLLAVQPGASHVTYLSLVCKMGTIVIGSSRECSNELMPIEPSTVPGTKQVLNKNQQWLRSPALYCMHHHLRMDRTGDGLVQVRSNVARFLGRLAISLKKPSVPFPPSPTRY